MTTLADIRASLKAGKPASKTASKADPLAAVRQSLKSGSKPAKTSQDLSKLNVADRLNRLEHIVGSLLTASPDAAKIQSSLAQLKPAIEAAHL